MYSYITLAFYAVLAEVLRRGCLILLSAFTGPLSKVPGPFLGKITPIPWLLQVVRGNHGNIGPGLFKKYGDVVRVAPKDVIFADKSSILKILVDEDLRKASGYESAREDPHIASLFSETDKLKHKQKRRLFSHGFSIGYINNLEPLMQDCLNVFTKVLDSKCSQGNGYAVVDMNRMFGNLTSDVMAAVSFGGTFGLVESDDAKQKDIFNNYLMKTTIVSLLPYNITHLPFIPAPSVTIQPLIDRIVAKRRSEMEKGTNKKDLLQMLIDAQDEDPISFTDKHLRDEMIMFMIAGSDTSSLTLTFTILLLVNNPEKLKNLVAEIDSKFRSEKDVTFAKTQELPYLNAVLNESMRVHPIITAGIGRQTTDTTVIGGYEIPGGILVAPWVSELQKDPKIWPDPEAFIPERWLGEYKGATVDRKAFMPFSAGTRNCIGQQFALKEMRLILATVVRQYELTLVPGQSHELGAYIVPFFKQGFYKVGLKRRI